MEKRLPAKTVERLSLYRRVLIENKTKNKLHIYSHQIAGLLHITPEQVRRDLMLIGYSSTLKKGYDIEQLINLIERILDTPGGLNVAVIGIGHLGTAITTYFKLKRENLNIIAAFDTDPKKVGRIIASVNCFHIDELHTQIKALNISIAILTLPAEYAKDITEKLVSAGIKGILNYTTVPLTVPPNVYLEEYDMITFLEKIAYFVKHN